MRRRWRQRRRREEDGPKKISEFQTGRIDAVSGWRRQLGLQEGKKGTSVSQPRGAAGTAAPSVIETQIDGDFEGWEGETIVKLMNGQIWQQTEYHYHYHYAFMPKVLVYRSGAGYKMKVDGVDKAVGVERLR